jgi:archaellum biogenesis ATPase FlaH
MTPNYIGSGQSYLIIPPGLSAIKLKSLETKNIIHVPGTLEEFSDAVKRQWPERLPPEKIMTDSAADRAAEINRLIPGDIEALRSVYPISRVNLSARFPKESAAQRNSALNFYFGFGPTWPVILNEQYAILEQFDHVYREISGSIAAGSKLNIVVGESGSGKSTCSMQVALRLAEENRLKVFEFVDNGSSIKSVLVAMSRLLSGDRALLLLDELHIYADELSEALESDSSQSIVILSSARSGEWKSRIKMLFPGNVNIVHFSRFSNNDVDELIKKILKYYPAPAFTKLSSEEKKERLRNSRRQLLIALREATESRQFDQIIEDEFSRILSSDARMLFYIVAFPTVARSGLEQSVAETIYNHVVGRPSFEDSLKQFLDGIIDNGRTGRLQTRHEVYARHIIDNVGKIDEIKRALFGILDYFAAFEMPIIRHVNALDVQIFKYVLNNKYLYGLFKNHGAPEKARELYEAFSTKFQLDGHFWLQYGLLLRRLGEHEEAFRTFEKSIQAYPENEFAVHALAQQKLIVAAMRTQYDDLTKRLINEALATLLERHSRFQVERRGRAFDEYPLVTLAYYHIDALYRHSKIDEAVSRAKNYFNQLQALPRRFQSDLVDELKGKLMLVVTHRTWEPLRYRKKEISYVAFDDDQTRSSTRRRK